MGQPRQIRWASSQADNRLPTASIPLTGATPFYATLDIRRFALVTALLSQTISLWLVSIANLRISSFPADSFYYFSHLPVTYWWGLAACLTLLFTRGFFAGRTRTALEMSTLFLLALYAFGLPAFSYQNPRILDSYLHESSALALAGNNGWFGAPVWYVRQFPGAFTFLSQLGTVAGVDPFTIMRFYPIVLSFVLVTIAYTIAKMYSQNYAVFSSGLLIGGLWFQLQVSPQSLDLIPYMATIFVLVKIMDDAPRRRIWTAIGVGAAFSFVVSHPETPLATILGVVGFMVLSLLSSKRAFTTAVEEVGPVLVVLVGWVAFWWGEVATEARILVQTQFIDKALSILSRGQTVAAAVPATPAPTYLVTLQLEEAISATIWIVGLIFLMLFRRSLPRERLLLGFFLAGVVTIPVALVGPADVLQRSYLFSLVPMVLFFPWILERRAVLTIVGRPLARGFKLGLIIAMIVFLALIPVTRYNTDPFQYLPQSSLASSQVGASLNQHSVLVLPLGDYGLRLYTGLDNNYKEVVTARSNNAGIPGVVVRGNETLQSDETSDYMLLSDYNINYYSLKFGHNAGVLISQNEVFEELVSLKFDLVYSTGSDFIYANPNLG